MTADQLRRTIRAELHAARCRGKDHSEERYFNDARELDRRMAEAGYELPHPTTWSAQYAQRLKGAISLNVIDDHPLGDAEA